MVTSRVICAISGGVDSAVSALLLKHRGYNVTGLFMRNWDVQEEAGYCKNEEDLGYAKRVCKVLDIPFHEVNLVKEYWINVFEPTIAEYEAGNTPNPDILCNHHVKFEALHKKCSNIFYNENFVIATGHYAQTSLGENVLKESFHGPNCRKENRLLQSIDPKKDQTFFLAKIPQAALRLTYFPLGHYYKEQVKEIAKNSEVSFTLERKESMGVCFIGKRKFSQFLKEYLPPKPGRYICYESGIVLGKHDGYYIYTVGQRSKLGGFKDTMVVLHKDLETGDVFLVSGSNHSSLYSRSIIVNDPHWICNLPAISEDKPFYCGFRFMHRHAIIPCSIVRLENKSLLVILDQPRRALTVGQTAVFYLENECLGGARICDVGPSMHECRSRDNIELAFYRKNVKMWHDLCHRFSELTFYEYDADEIVGYNMFCHKSEIS